MIRRQLLLVFIAGAIVIGGTHFFRGGNRPGAMTEWNVVEPPGCGFRVSMPRTPDETPVGGKLLGLVGVHGRAWTSCDPDLYSSFAVLRLDDSFAPLDANSYLQSMASVSALAQKGNKSYEVKASVGVESPSRDLVQEFDDDAGMRCYRASRFLIVGKVLFELQVISRKRELLDPGCQRFFDSFQLVTQE
jgi:hypothetical protein